MRSRKKSKDTSKPVKMRTQQSKIWDTGKAIVREIHSMTDLSQKTRKSSNK